MALTIGYNKKFKICLTLLIVAMLIIILIIQKNWIIFESKIIEFTWKSSLVCFKKKIWEIFLFKYTLTKLECH